MNKFLYGTAVLAGVGLLAASGMSVQAADPAKLTISGGYGIKYAVSGQGKLESIQGSDQIVTHGYFSLPWTTIEPQPAFPGLPEFTIDPEDLVVTSITDTAGNAVGGGGPYTVECSQYKNRKKYPQQRLHWVLSMMLARLLPWLLCLLWLVGLLLWMPFPTLCPPSRMLTGSQLKPLRMRNRLTLPDILKKNPTNPVTAADYADADPTELSPSYIAHDGGVNFSASSILDSGIEVGASLSLKIKAKDSVDADGTSAYISGSFGKVIFGNTDPASKQLAITAPSGGYGVNGEDYFLVSRSADPTYINVVGGAAGTVGSNLAEKVYGIKGAAPLHLTVQRAMRRTRSRVRGETTAPRSALVAMETRLCTSRLP